MSIQILLSVVLLTATACNAEPTAHAAPSERAVSELSPKDVATLINEKRAVTIIDANPRKIFDDGHVPGARWLGDDDIAQVLPKDKAALVVFYCYNESCGASHGAAKAAIAAGWQNVARMPAGISGWKKANLPLER